MRRTVAQRAPAALRLTQTGGVVTDVAWEAGADTLFIGQGAQVLAIDVATPGAPRVRARSAWLGGIVRDVTMAGTHLCVAHDHGVAILDGRMGEALAQLGDWSSGIGHNDVCRAVGSHWYLVGGTGPDVVLDVADPASPRQAGSFSVGGPRTDLAIRGHTGVSAHLWSLQSLDFTDPSAPVSLDAVKFEFGINAVAFLGDHALAASDGLYVVPWRGFPNAGTGHRIDTEGAVTALGVDDTRVGAIVARADGPVLALYDLALAEAPRALGHVAVPHAREVVVRGSRAFVAAGQAGLIELDLERPEAPQIVARFDPDAWPADDLVVQDGWLWLSAGDRGVAVVDASSGQRIVEPPTLGPERVLPVAERHMDRDPVSGRVVVAAGAYVSGSPAGELEVFDGALPPTAGGLRRVGRMGLETVPRGVSVADEHAYVIGSTADLLVFDIAEGDPRLVERVVMDDAWLTDVLATPPRAFVVDSNVGLRVFDVGDSHGPTEVQRLAYFTHGTSRGLALGAGELLVTGSRDALPLGQYSPPPIEPVLTIDVSSSVEARLGEVSQLHVWPRAMALTRDILAVASSGRGHRLQPDTHELVLRTRPDGSVVRVTLPSRPDSVALAGQRAFVAGGDAGVLTVDLGIEPQPTTTMSPPTVTPALPPSPHPVWVPWLLAP